MPFHPEPAAAADDQAGPGNASVRIEHIAVGHELDLAEGLATRNGDGARGAGENAGLPAPGVYDAVGGFRPGEAGSRPGTGPAHRAAARGPELEGARIPEHHIDLAGGGSVDGCRVARRGHPQRHAACETAAVAEAAIDAGAIGRQAIDIERATQGEVSQHLRNAHIRAAPKGEHRNGTRRQGEPARRERDASRIVPAGDTAGQHAAAGHRDGARDGAEPRQRRAAAHRHRGAGERGAIKGQRAGGNGGGTRVGASGAQLQSARPQLRQGTRAGNHAIEHHGAGAIEGEGRACGDGHVADDGAPGIPRAHLQRAGGHRGASGVGVCAPQHEGSRTLLDQRAGAGSRTPESKDIRPIEGQRRARAGRDAAENRATGAAGADLQRAGRKRGAAVIDVGAGKHERAAALLHERAARATGRAAIGDLAREHGAVGGAHGHRLAAEPHRAGAGKIADDRSTAGKAADVEGRAAGDAQRPARGERAAARERERSRGNGGAAAKGAGAAERQPAGALLDKRAARTAAEAAIGDRAAKAPEARRIDGERVATQADRAFARQTPGREPRAHGGNVEDRAAPDRQVAACREPRGAGQSERAGEHIGAAGVGAARGEDEHLLPLLHEPPGAGHYRSQHDTVAVGVEPAAGGADGDGILKRHRGVELQCPAVHSERAGRISQAGICRDGQRAAADGPWHGERARARERPEAVAHLLEEAEALILRAASDRGDVEGPGAGPAQAQPGFTPRHHIADDGGAGLDLQDIHAVTKGDGIDPCHPIA